MFALLFVSSIAHESTHAVIALMLGYQIIGIHFGFPVSYVQLAYGEHSNPQDWWIISISGGIINAVGLALIWFKGRKYFRTNEQTVIVLFMVLELVYSFWEAFVYPSL